MHSEQLNLEPKLEKYDTYNRFKEEEPFYVGACLAGLDTKEAWEIRLYLLGKGLNGRRGVAQGLAGITTDNAYKLREDLLDEASESTARGLAGDDSERAWQMREKIKEHINEEGVTQGLAESLANIDTPRAWAWRQELSGKEESTSAILEGLVGVDSEEAWALREKYIYEYPAFVAESLLGLSGKFVDGIRDRLKGIDEQALLMSYTGSGEEAAWELRNKFIEINPFYVGTSLAGLDNERADTIRKKLMDQLVLFKSDPVIYNKIRKGLLQGMNSNYIFESLHLNN
jgi:hypothetical protein